MSESNSHLPSLPALLRKAALTAYAAFENRGELFLVELEQEKTKFMESMIWGAVVCFSGMMFTVVLTGTIVFLFPEDLRIYAAGGFCLVYLLGAILALLNLKALAKKATRPFPDTVQEFKKDLEWLESSK